MARQQKHLVKVRGNSLVTVNKEANNSEPMKNCLNWPVLAYCGD